MCPVTSEPADLLISGPVALTVRACVRHWRALLAVGLLPVGMLLMTVACEWLLRSAYGVTWMDAGAAAAGVHITIAVARMLAAGLLLGSLAWLVGATLFESRPSVAEALGEGWRASVRCGLTVLPLWFLSAVYAFLMVLMARMAWAVYTPASAWAPWLALVLVASLALPPLLAVTARYMLCVPIVMFDRCNPFQALSVAAVHVPWRAMTAHWAAYGGYALCILGCVLLPSWFFVGSIYVAAAPAYANGDAIALGQAFAAMSCLVLVPFGIALCTIVYFRMRPDYWATPAEEDQVQPPGAGTGV
jgi:hypothetical protein